MTPLMTIHPASGEQSAEDAHRKTIRRKRFFAGGAVVLCVYLCGPLFWLGPQTFTILARASRVQVFKIYPNSVNLTGSAEIVNHHAVLATGHDLSGKNILRLKAILLSPNRYIIGPFDDSKCEMSPGIAFRLWRGRQHADVAVCYTCGHISVSTCDATGQEVRAYQTPFPVLPLSGLVRGAFPGDTELAGNLARYEVNEGRELRKNGTIRP